MHNGKIGSFDILVESARGTAHPPVLATLAVRPAQGKLPAGLLLKKSASGLVPWDTGDIAGVLDRPVDTAVQDSALVIIHGSALLEMLKVGIAGAEPDETTLAALLRAGVYPE